MGTTEITVTPGTQQVVITRELTAPRELVFRAYTEPELFVQWMGPRVLITTVELFDVRDGGRWQYVAVAPDGSQHRFHGVFHGDPSPERIVQTFEYEGTPTRLDGDGRLHRIRGWHPRHRHRGLPVPAGPRRDGRIGDGGRCP